MVKKPPNTERVEFRGRLVHPDYPKRHAEAQSVTVYADFNDGTSRKRIKYGDAKDRYPGGITYATREEKLEARLSMLKDPRMRSLYGEGDTPQLEARVRAEVDAEETRTDHRCADCDVDVGEYHLPGCDVERCPKCLEQAIGCGCTEQEEEEDFDADA